MDQGLISRLQGLLQSRQWAVAERQAWQATRLYPDDFRSWRFLGLAATEMGLKEPALEAFLRAHALSGDDPVSLGLLGNAYQKLDRNEEAAECFRRVTELKPDWAEIQAALGGALVRLGKPQEAEPHFGRALALNPDLLLAHHQRTAGLLDLGRLDEAEASYRKAVSLKPDLASVDPGLARRVRMERRRREIHRHLARAAAMPEGQDAPLSVTPESAIAAAGRGDHRHAVWIMRLLIGADPASAGIFAAHDSAAVRLDALEAERVVPGITIPHLAEIHRPSPLLGHAGEGLDALQRRKIEALLSLHWRDWEEAGHPAPPDAGVFAAGRGFRWDSDARPKVAIVFPKYINNNPDYIESDYYIHLTASAEAAGLAVRSFDAGEVLYDYKQLFNKLRPQRPFAEAARELSAFLAAVKPDIVVADGNYVPRGDAVDAAYWNGEKRRLGFKLTIVIPDCYDDFVDYAEGWRDCADLVFTLNQEARQLIGLPHCVAAPIFPMHEGCFNRTATKDLGVTCIGTDGRYRRDWMEPLAAAGVPTMLRLHDRSRNNAPDQAEYADLLARSKCLFNNGYISDGINIITGRFFEGVLSRAVVLQQAGAPIDRYFLPFIHYVPVDNIHSLIQFSRFLLQAEEWRERIATAALECWDRHYASRLNWQFLCARLLGDGR